MVCSRKEHFVCLSGLSRSHYANDGDSDLQYQQLSPTDTLNTTHRSSHQCALSSYNSHKMFFHRRKSILGKLQKMTFSMYWTKQICLLVSLSVLLCFNLELVGAQSLQFTDRTFLDKFIQEFGNDNTLTEDQLQKLILALRKQGIKNSSETHSVDSGDNFAQSCNRSSDDWKTNKFCLENQCLNASDILELYSFSPSTDLTGDDLQKLTTALLYQSHNEGCMEGKRETTRIKPRPESGQSWGYGFLFVTIINICALGGAIMMPFMKTTIYKQVLMFMVGLAVGSLAGSGLLFLIPEAFHLVGEESHSDYIWKATTIFGGIYLFFLIERLLKFVMEWKKQRKLRKAHVPKSASSDSVATDDYGICSVHLRSPSSALETAKMKGLNDNVHVHGPVMCSSAGDDSPSMSRENSTLTEISNVPDSENKTNSNGVQMNGDSGQEEGDHQLTKSEEKDFREKNEIATMAWMIIFGDGLHNFIDGLSIGAAFTESILTGVSVSVAVICEELPHELGDFAILLNSGMSFKKALLFNFLSACMCYFGLIIGILLGQNTTAHDWVFAIAGGMFLYISLVDMLPEMNRAAEEEEKRTGQACSLQVFAIQNAGILIGYACLLLMALFGHMIVFD